MINVKFEINCDNASDAANIAAAIHVVLGGGTLNAVKERAPYASETTVKAEVVNPSKTEKAPKAEKQAALPKEEPNPETPAEEKPADKQKDETPAAASKAPAKLEWADIRPKCMEVTKQLKEWKVERPGDLINQARTEVLPGSEHLAALEKHPELWPKMWETVDALLVTHKPA